MNLALLAAAATGVQVGAAMVATRMVVTDVPPLTLAMLRYGIGLLCLLPFAMQQNRSLAHIERAKLAIKSVAFIDLLAMAALGIGQFGLLIALLNFGLQHIGAAAAALIFSMFPMLTLLLSALLGRDAISLRLFAGVTMTIAGVVVSVAPKLASLGRGPWWGELAVLGSAFVGALCSVLYRPYLKRYPTLNVSAFAMLSSVVVLALVALPEHWPQRMGTFSPHTWAVIVFIGVSSGIGYFLWLYALKHETPTRVTVFLSLNPVTAGILGNLILNEPLDGWILGATALIALGLWLATRGAGKA